MLFMTTRMASASVSLVSPVLPFYESLNLRLKLPDQTKVHDTNNKDKDKKVTILAMIVSCVSLFCPCVSSSLLHWLGTQATTGKADAPFSKKHLSCKSSHPRQKFKSPLVNNLFTQSCFPLNFGLFKESMYQALLFCHILLIWKAIIGFAGVFRTAFLQTTAKHRKSAKLPWHHNFELSFYPWSYSWSWSSSGDQSWARS